MCFEEKIHYNMQNYVLYLKFLIGLFFSFQSVVDEQTAGGVDVVRLQCFVSHIPDTLYMVEDNAPHQPTYAPTTTVDVVAAALPG